MGSNGLWWHISPWMTPLVITNESSHSVKYYSPQTPYSLLLCTKQRRQLQGKVWSAASCRDHLNECQQAALCWRGLCHPCCPVKANPGRWGHCPDHWGSRLWCWLFRKLFIAWLKVEGWASVGSCTILWEGFTFSVGGSWQKQVMVSSLVSGGLCATIFWTYARIWYLFPDRFSETKSLQEGTDLLLPSTTRQGWFSGRVASVASGVNYRLGTAVRRLLSHQYKILKSL